MKSLLRVRSTLACSFRARSHALAILAQKLIICIEHFGSTAVPGLAAKPVIDLLVGSALTLKQVAAQLEALGYSYWPDNPDPGGCSL